ncbi:head GIN domain-containing protein [Temperatibacter marinus]|uniref:Head GIN domain-containing protein n=1 Tax=Temperatibacter marinus TaxID=1456591 RepID=A0AA52H9U9_9PROT|nr:head GIN domain-containing protein [Temperatibacter marinus]WND03294.1 head GIN domain-containing protein [Temperatibacter marinus]
MKTIPTIINKKTLLTAVTGLALMGASFSGSALVDDSENRDLDTFHSLMIKGGIELDVKIGSSQKVKIAVDDDLDLSEVITKVENGFLIIDVKRKKNFWGGKKQSGEVSVTLTMTDFQKVHVKGAVDGDIEGIDSENVSLEVYGAADLDITGKCGKLSVNVRGAGDLDADNLRCKEADINISGAGNAKVYSSEKVKAIVSGVGSVTIEGNPKDITKKIRGLGNIRIK